MSVAARYRGTRRTTDQMKCAPKRAVFVWCNNQLNYPRDLAKRHGRADLEIVGPDWLTDNRWRGRELTGLVIDHALVWTERLLDAFDGALTRVRRVV